MSSINKYLVFLLICFFVIIVKSNELASNTNLNFSICDQLTSDLSISDSQITQQMKSNLEPFIKDHSKCLETLLNTGKYDSSQYLLSTLLSKGLKFKESLKKSVNNIETKLKNFYNKFRFEENEFQVASPVIQWAQSLNHIYLHIKFSHRHDSPGCQEVRNLKVNLQASILDLSAYCIQADIPIKFELKMPFFVDVNPVESNHSEQSNGRYTFSLLKGQTGMYWDRLVKEVSDYPKHTRLWLEMHEKYKHQIENFMNDDEEDEFKQLMNDLNKNKKRYQKKKVKFDK
jgi:hypothetical protein